ncbi:MAG: DUF3311 domain-containing protein [Acidobacteria bacterium]|nr:MAG: DUF3311 domain-containing protein [Acidobacteriota bacterium]TDI45580.1 MAG: DUF3311 domain-containing protein [Acidobacteriota bacterium]
MKGRGIRVLLVAAMAALFILRHDDWLASSDMRVLGLPASLTWHVGLCVAATLIMALAAAFAWPRGLDDDDSRGGDA